MSDENDTPEENTEPPSTTEVDHMAEMAAAMEAEGIPVDSAAIDELLSPPDEDEDISAEAEPAEVDHMAEMAAAMEAEGIPVDSGSIDELFAQAAADVESTDMRSMDAEAIAREVSGKDVNIDTLLKVPVSLSIEVGRTQIPLNELLNTQEGSVIELERLLDDPLDILVNGALIAHGVVVLANERFGIQITDIISLQERARSL